MKYSSYIIVAGIILSACNTVENKPVEISDSSSNTSDSSGKKNDPAPETDAVKKGTSINLNKDTIVLPELKDSIVASGYLKGMGKHVTFIIPVNSGSALVAEIISVDTANIRINQVYTPSNKADGPFQKKLSFPVKEFGNYKVIIGENQMAGEQWEGNFKIKFSIH